MEIMSDDEQDALRTIYGVASQLGLSERDIEKRPYRDIVMQELNS